MDGLDWVVEVLGGHTVGLRRLRFDGFYRGKEQSEYGSYRDTKGIWWGEERVEWGIPTEGGR